MIGEPKIVVKCDTCEETITIDPSYDYIIDYPSNGMDFGYWRCDEDSIREELEDVHFWTITEDHEFCSQHCAKWFFKREAK